jgi:hypothetical protein
MPRLPLALAALLLATACDSVARIEVDPGAIRVTGRGKVVKVHATPFEKNGRAVPKEVCAWTSSDEKVAAVKASHNNADVTSVGPGQATVRCAIGGVTGEAAISVRVVARLEVEPARAELKLQDDPAPLALRIQALDEGGAPVASVAAAVTCASEAICRGDGRGQLWPVGPGETTATVRWEGAEATLPVKVVEARSADMRPKAVTGNPMEAYEKAVQQRDAAEKKKKR